ncbi:MAG: hypothetical protein R6V05_09915, partial [Candidatus Brocadiia bacterium]
MVRFRPGNPTMSTAREDLTQNESCPVSLRLEALESRLLLSGVIERVSLDSAGDEVIGNSYAPDVSDDGRYVTFSSYSAGLVSGDANGVSDVFVYDRQTDTIERVSLASDGSEGNGASAYSAISDDGRFVAFWSEATNLVTGDTNGHADIFVYDRQSDTIERVSVASDGTQADAASQKAAISGTGRYVTFQSEATNLVAGDTNGVRDIFVHDLENDTTERVSLTSGGGEGSGNSSEPSISDDGRYVSFHSTAGDLVSGDTNFLPDAFV